MTKQRRALPSGFFHRIATVITLRSERRTLARLTDAELADIGLSRTEAMREAARPFWDIAGAFDQDSGVFCQDHGQKPVSTAGCA